MINMELIRIENPGLRKIIILCIFFSCIVIPCIAWEEDIWYENQINDTWWEYTGYFPNTYLTYSDPYYPSYVSYMEGARLTHIRLGVIDPYSVVWNPAACSQTAYISTWSWNNNTKIAYFACEAQLSYWTDTNNRWHTLKTQYTNFGHCGTPYTYPPTVLNNATETYKLNFSSSGTYCYGSPITVSVSKDPQSGVDPLFFWYSYDTNGNQYSSWSGFTGMSHSFIKSFPTGNWTTKTIMQYEDDRYKTEWLNFSIIQDCSIAFNGTINQTFNPWGLTNFDWDWDYSDLLNDLAPFTPGTCCDMDNKGNGSCYTDILFKNGYINETEYDDICAIILDARENQANMTLGTDMHSGLLAPLYIINDSISFARASINSSYIVLFDNITPITSIFGYFLEMIPSVFISLISVILSLDLAKVILAWRKS